MTLSYEKAKELKEAGFPQKEYFTNLPHGLRCAEFGCAECMVMDSVYRPTSDELIKELVKIAWFTLEPLREFEARDGLLFRVEGGDWLSEGKETGRVFCFECPSPLEALAELYIKLHKES